MTPATRLCKGFMLAATFTAAPDSEAMGMVRKTNANTESQRTGPGNSAWCDIDGCDKML